MLVDTQHRRETFYNDCDDETVKKANALVKPHSMKALLDTVEQIAWANADFNGRRGYIRCLQDNTINIQLQDIMIKASGVDWITKPIDSSHCPFLSRPEDLAKMVGEIYGELV